MSCSPSPSPSRGSWPTALPTIVVLRCKELGTDHAGEADLDECGLRRTPVEDCRVGVTGAPGRGRGDER